MDFTALIKKSFEIAWNNKILWLFGFLSGGAGTVGYLNPGGFNFTLPANVPPQPEIEETGTKIAGKVLGISDSSLSFLSNETLLLLILLIVLLLLILVIVGIFITNWASAALVASILARNKEKPTLRAAAAAGLKYWWKYWLLVAIVGLFIFAVFGALALPVIFLFLFNMQALAIAFAISALIVFILFIFVVGIVGTLLVTLAQRMIIHKGFGAADSLRLSWHLVRKNLADSVLTYLVVIGLGFAASFAFMIAIFPIGVVIIALFVVKLWWIAMIILIPALFGLVTASGFWQTFLASYWTLFYEHLASKEGW